MELSEVMILFVVTLLSDVVYHHLIRGKIMRFINTISRLSAHNNRRRRMSQRQQIPRNIDGDDIGFDEPVEIGDLQYQWN